MNKLPQEVFDLIVQDLDFENLPVRLSQYATINRQWQYAVERRLFTKLWAYTNEMTMLESVLRNSRRRGYLRSLKYTMKEACWNRPNTVSRLRRSSQRNAWKKELNLMNELMHLWNLLSPGWNRPLSERTPSLMLCLEISEPKNHVRKSKNARDPFFSSSDFPWARMMLPGVKSLSVIWGVMTSRGAQKAHFSHPPWLFSLLATCPSATEITWRGFEPYIPTTIVAPGYRERMTASLAAVGMLGNLRHLTLHFDTPSLGPLKQDIQACRQPAPGTLNQVLHKLSQQLVSLHLTGRFLLSPDLFWPKAHGSKGKPSTETPTPFWPHLQQIHIEARLASPEGRFYFDPACKSTRPSAMGRWHLRSVAASDASAAGDLLVRVTRAMLRMPELRRLSVIFPEFPWNKCVEHRAGMATGQGPGLWRVALSNLFGSIIRLGGISDTNHTKQLLNAPTLVVIR
ncbi:hypothetical protein C8A01DRAFT_15093 [Parachaetomium inaequale]|uniref:F-box domain-containing protein n=1 Tax=Parachaetomium inaequale TaxID=2588326 RepID=A0AAN6PI77_9PEZI|nr:hypothetical protein C8A01DRAFT_15093 [Parachaetomium inaequale]